MGRGGSSAVRQLATLLRDEQEHIRRAAGYGLTVSGADGVAPLLELLADPAPLPAAAAALEQRGFLGPDMCQHCKVNALHVLGQLASQTAAARTEPVVAAIGAALQLAAEQIDAFAANISAETLEELSGLVGNNYVADIAEYMYVVERRRTIAAGCEALGLIGSNALLADPPAAVLHCARILVGTISQPEPGVDFPAFMTINTVQHNAGTALVRLCSDPGLRRGAVPKRHGARDLGEAELMPSSEFGLEVLQGMVVEALDRLRLLAEGGGGGGRRELLKQLEAVAWPWSLPAESPYLTLS